MAPELPHRRPAAASEKYKNGAGHSLRSLAAKCSWKSAKSKLGMESHQSLHPTSSLPRGEGRVARRRRRGIGRNARRHACLTVRSSCPCLPFPRCGPGCERRCAGSGTGAAISPSCRPACPVRGSPVLPGNRHHDALSAQPLGSQHRIVEGEHTDHPCPVLLRGKRMTDDMVPVSPSPSRTFLHLS